MRDLNGRVAWIPGAGSGIGAGSALDVTDAKAVQAVADDIAKIEGRHVSSVTAADCARMVQPNDCGELILLLARLPSHVCINDMTISPT